MGWWWVDWGEREWGKWSGWCGGRAFLIRKVARAALGDSDMVVVAVVMLAEVRS